ncbi:MAG: putative toxin-antitoxin system toxin component, PIN family [Syntrophobacteraceae bacterium]
MGKIKVVRVVIDTNVLISALLFGGVPGRVVSLWKLGLIQPLASQAMIDEVLRVLAYPKFGLTPKEIELLLYEEILPWFEIVDVATGNPFIEDDPSDDMFLWCAMDGKADQVISGDEHLLQLQDFPVPILTPRQFLDLVESDR